MPERTTIALLLFVGFALGSFSTEQFVAPRLDAEVIERTTKLNEKTLELQRANETINLLTSKSTVLYEDAPAGVDVLHGLARVEAGRELGGTPLVQRTIRWVIPFAIRPLAMPSNHGAAYAYMDKTSGEISRVMSAPLAPLGQAAGQ